MCEFCYDEIDYFWVVKFGVQYVYVDKDLREFFFFELFDFGGGINCIVWFLFGNNIISIVDCGIWFFVSEFGIEYLGKCFCVLFVYCENDCFVLIRCMMDVIFVCIVLFKYLLEFLNYCLIMFWDCEFLF